MKIKPIFFFVIITLMLGTNNVYAGKRHLKAKKHIQPISIIFDTDMGNDVDDAMALDMLHKYINQGRAKVLAIMSNKEDKASPEFIDLMDTWYGHPNIPIGIVRNGAECSNINYAQTIVNMQENGKPLYARSIPDVTKLLDAHKLYRKILSKQPDHSVVIISTGFSTNLARLLDSKADSFSSLSGKQLVAKKVKFFSIMGGSHDMEPMREYNIVTDIPSAKELFAQCPVPIVSSPFEVGVSICYPASSIENDFSWTAHHPMIEAYKSYLKMPFDRPTWDLTAVLYVMEPDSAFFNKTESGIITVDNNGVTQFTPSPKGKHYFLSVSKQQGDRIKNYFIRLISARPSNKK